MPTIKAILALIEQQLKIAKRGYANEIDGWEAAKEVFTNTYVKPKAPKKPSKKQEAINRFHQTLIDAGVHKIIFDFRYSFTWQYRMNCADIQCTMLKIDGEDADDLCNIENELGEVLYTPLKKASGEEGINATVLINLFKGTNVQLMAVGTNDAVPRDITVDDYFYIRSGSDS